MTPAAWLVARRTLLDRPWRSALLLAGYGAGVAIMIALLSVGDALLLQARDRNLVAGGDVAVLPEGIDPAVVKVNGVTGLFLTISPARFIVRDVIDGPRFRSDVIAAAPQLSDRLVYVRTHGRTMPAMASAGIPSLDQQAHAARAIAGGRDNAADRAWLVPSIPALAGRVDHFHAVPGGPAGRAKPVSAWAEWDYFNVLDPATRSYAYLTLLAGPNGLGAVLARVRVPGAPVEDILIPSRLGAHDISMTTADQRVGPARVWTDAAGYRLTVDDARLHVNLRIRPDPGFMLPPAELRQESTISGYVVPVVRGRVDGSIRTAHRVLRLVDAPAYHDHNWGTWRGVTWEWGEASARAGALLYGELHLPENEPPAGVGRRSTLFVWSAGTGGSPGGLTAVLPIRAITYGGWRPGPYVTGRRVRAPGIVTIVAGEGGDTATVRIKVWDVLGSTLLGVRSGAGSSRRAPVFLQLRGDAELTGTVGGRPVAWRGPSASETFVRP